MTNLSKELCEICGIEPKLDGSNPDLSVQPVYPDFTKPENFTRLLNLPTEIIIKNGQTIPAKNIWWIINTEAKNYKVLAPYYFEALLIRLIVILENENKIYSDEFVNRIKQAINETEWVYG